MSTQDNNGAAPAFPIHGDPLRVPCSGLTKREYAAIEIAKGLLSNPSYGWADHVDVVRADAVRQADAILEALSEPLALEQHRQAWENLRVVIGTDDELPRESIERVLMMIHEKEPSWDEPPAPQEGTGADLPDHCYACEKPCVYSDIPDPTNGAARCVDCLVKIQATHIKNLEGAASPSPTEGGSAGGAAVLRRDR